MAERKTPQSVTPHGARPWGLCTAFMTELPITGAVISIVDRAGHRSTVATTDLVAARWDELELELGIGPLHDASNESAPQLISDVRTRAVNPLIGAHLEQLGVRALFAFPLVLGTATVGVAGLYRSSPGALSSEALATALFLVRSATEPAVREALRLATHGTEPDSLDAGPGLRREVHQATGMVSAQLDVSTTEAFALLRAHSMSSGRSISAVSWDVVHGLLNFLDLDLV